MTLLATLHSHSLFLICSISNCCTQTLKTLPTVAPHSDGHHDHHDDGAERAVGFYTLWEDYATKTDACVVGLKPGMHYHFYVVSMVEEEGQEPAQVMLYDVAMANTQPENAAPMKGATGTDPFAIACYVAIGVSALIVASIYFYFSCGEQAAKTQPSTSNV